VVVEIEALEEKDLQNFFTSLQKQTMKDMQAGIRKALDMKVDKVLEHECTKHDLQNQSNRMFLLSYKDYPKECATWVSEAKAIEAASHTIRAYNRRVTAEEKKVVAKVAAAKKAAAAAAQKEALAESSSRKQQQKEEKEAAAAMGKAAQKRNTNDARTARPKRSKKEDKK
jgi:hypothetical protein